MLYFSFLIDSNANFKRTSSQRELGTVKTNNGKMKSLREGLNAVYFLSDGKTTKIEPSSAPATTTAVVDDEGNANRTNSSNMKKEVFCECAVRSPGIGFHTFCHPQWETIIVNINIILFSSFQLSSLVPSSFSIHSAPH